MAFPKVTRAEKARKPRAGIPFNQTMILELIQVHSGNISRIADSIGASRGALSTFIEKHPDIQAALKQARERQIDQLEESVWKRAISSTDTGLQAFLLKTQARHRGYDQDEARAAAKDIAEAAFAFIINQTNNPAERKPKAKSKPKS